MLRRTALALAAALLTSAASAQSCPAWSAIPEAQGPNNVIRSIAVMPNNHIAARGEFTAVNGIPTPGIAEFDGGVWTPLTAVWPANMSAYEHTLATLRGRLYASGNPFGGGQGVIWNGLQWNQWPATGVTGVNTKAVHNAGDSLLVEGVFAFPISGGGTMTRALALWDGTAYRSMGTQWGPNRLGDSLPYIKSVARYNGQIYIAGGFAAVARGNAYNTNTVNSRYICVFDGTQFNPLPGSGLNGEVNSIAVFQNELYVGGDFTATDDGSVQLNRLASFDGTWHRVGGGVSSRVMKLLVADDGTGEKLHVYTNSGSSTAYNAPMPTGDTVSFRGVVRWNGSRFTAYGGTPASGLNEGPVTDAVSAPTNAGEALFCSGIRHYGGPVPGYAYLSRWGPGTVLTDTDNDGIPDTWEQNGIDGDCNGTIDLNLPAMGANWQRKDIFVEVDSMTGRAPAQATLDRVVTAFANAPAALVNNPNGQAGVNLHLIVDAADQNIPLQSFPNNFVEFHALKHQYFGSLSDYASPNRDAILTAKRRVFHYCIFGNTYGGTSSSGLGEVLGNDFMVTLGAWPTPGGTPDEQAATFMHELGHNLGLQHGGHQDDENRFNYKPNYHSIMNYTWQCASNRPGWTLDYSRQVLPTINENALDENAGIGGAPGAITLIGPSPVRASTESGPVDWNNDGLFGPTGPVDVNRIRAEYPASLDVLEGSEDWSRLRYNFRVSPNYASGDSPESTLDRDRMTAELDAALDALFVPPSCAADLGAAGGVPGADGVLNNNDFIVFITHFFNADTRADLGVAGGLPGHDGQYNNNDFIAFISLFFEGCG